MPKVDLHIHSSVSDGRFSPAELVRKSAGAGLTLISLTDHDNVDGIPAALEEAENYPLLKLIPGVEISTDVPDGEVHLLGYFIDYSHQELLLTLKKMRDSRLERAQGMVENLAKLGLPLSWERVLEIAGSGSIGRPHIAQALLEKGYITTFKEAFTRYLAWGGPAYIKREKITPSEGVELILRAEGLPVLAHPLTVNDPESLVARLKENGLAGIEAYYKDYTGADTRRLVGLAERFGLIVTSGSDYHGLDDSTETMIGRAAIPLAVEERLIALAEQRMLKPVNPG
ncbi:MAG: PHP domain-containing protein [Dehalococcoidales bacterium]